jgi:DNA-directed RNA polymerase delta subunit
MTDDIRDIILSNVEASLEAQLRAVRRLRQGPIENTQAPRKQSRSQVDLAYDILRKARTPLHVSEIIDRIQTQFGVAIDRESLVSSLSKKVAREDRFVRPEKNTFSLRPENR